MSRLAHVSLCSTHVSEAQPVLYCIYVERKYIYKSTNTVSLSLLSLEGRIRGIFFKRGRLKSFGPRHLISQKPNRRPLLLLNIK